MGEVYSHLSEEERQVVQIEVGNDTSIRRIGAMPGRSPSTISREIKRNAWFPSNQNESYRPYRPKRLKAGPWTGRYYVAGPAQRKADRRRRKPRRPCRLSHDRLWAQVALFAPLPKGARLSVTHDNGTEFARRGRLRSGLGMDTWFADPYSSWQRGSNENRNGMLRRYMPKRSEITLDMGREPREIVDETDNRPMRVLGYRTPAEAFMDELLGLQA